MGDMRFDVVDSLKVALPHGMGSKWDGMGLDWIHFLFHRYGDTDTATDTCRDSRGNRYRYTLHCV